jgi:hypothetical protein
MIQVELAHKKCAAGERRISELEAELALSTEEAASLKNHVKSLEEKIVEVTNLKYQVELVEHRLTQAQQRIKVNFPAVLSPPPPPVRVTLASFVILVPFISNQCCCTVFLLCVLCHMGFLPGPWSPQWLFIRCLQF